MGKAWVKIHENTTETRYEMGDRQDQFKFGEKVYESKYFKRIPISLGDMKETIEVAVIDANIPLLLSKRQLKKWDAVLNFSDATLKIGKTNQTFKLKETEGGHLALPLTKEPEENREELLKKVYCISKNKTHQTRDLKRIHRVFGHPRPERILSLLKEAGMLDEGLSTKLTKISKACQICHKYQKSVPKPKVGLQKAREINEIISVDLKPVSSLIGKNDDRYLV